MLRKIEHWLNKRYSESKIKVTFYNRSKIAKITGYITVILFVSTIVLLLSAPKERIEVISTEFRTIEPFYTILSVLIIVSTVTFIIFSIFYSKATKLLELKE